MEIGVNKDEAQFIYDSIIYALKMVWENTQISVIPKLKFLSY